MALLTAASVEAQGSTVLNGDWLGELRPGPVILRLVLHLQGSGGTFESIDQHASLPIKTLTLTGEIVSVDVGIATFEGKLNGAKGEIDGTFRQGPGSYPLLLKKANAATMPSAARSRPQEPVPPYPYASEEVVVVGGKGTKLAGTLTYPREGGPFAVVLLLSGSGPQDRDESLMGHRPFLVLSDYLTRQGFAVLRLDDRGTGKSEGVFADATYEDKIADALAGVAFLKQRREVSPGRIGLIGHSEGGIIGPMAAARSGDVGFVVMMAGLGVNGTEVMRQQGIDTVRAAGGSEQMVQKQVEVQGKLFAILKEEKDPAVFAKRVRELIPGPAADAQIQMLLSHTVRDLLASEPGKVLRELSCPVLAINGSKDTQVSAKMNLPAIAAALVESKTTNWSVVELPGLNHLFQTAKTGGVDEYATIEETIAPSALRTIADWLKNRFSAAPKAGQP